MPLDDNDKKTIGEMLKAALADLPGLISGAVKPVADRVDAIETARKAAEDEAKKKAAAEDEAKKKAGAAAAGAGGATAESTELAKLRAEVEAEKKARQEAEQKARNEATERQVRDMLVSAGVPADRVKHAIASLRADGALVEQDGTPRFKGKVANVDGVHALEDGLKAWVKGEGQIFIPPKAVAGTGEATKVEAPRTQAGALDVSQLAGRLNVTGALAGID